MSVAVALTFELHCAQVASTGVSTRSHWGQGDSPARDVFQNCDASCLLCARWYRDGSCACLNTLRLPTDGLVSQRTCYHGERGVSISHPKTSCQLCRRPEMPRREANYQTHHHDLTALAQISYASATKSHESLTVTNRCLAQLGALTNNLDTSLITTIYFVSQIYLCNPAPSRVLS